MEKNIILAYLRQDARISLTKMSKKTRVPVSTLYDHLKKYQKTCIKKHTSILDFEKLGYKARAKVLLKVNKKDRENLREFLNNCQFINELVKINNGYDYLIEFIFENMKDLENYLEKMEQKFEIKENKVFYIVDDIKRENFMANPQLQTIGKPL
ncbi:MAG: Lrp/AsnC family transcriptional regulator [archaeon]